MLAVHLVCLKRLFKVINVSAVYKSEELSARDLICYATLKCFLEVINSFANILSTA